MTAAGHRTHVSSLTGDCDGAVSGGTYVENALGRNTVPIHKVTPRGANHNYFNTEWSYDNDSKCSSGLTPAQQRQLARTYIPAFFRQYSTDASTRS